MQQSIDISCPPGPQQQTCSSGFAPVGPCWNRQTDIQTDGHRTITQTLLRILCGHSQQRTQRGFALLFVSSCLAWGHHIAVMWLIVTVVTWSVYLSVCLLVTSMSCAQTAEPIEMSFETLGATAVASELWGQGVHCTPQVHDLYPLYSPRQRCGLCQNFKQRLELQDCIRFVHRGAYAI